MTFAHYDFDAGASIHEHSHSNEEVWTVLEGELEVTVGGESFVAGPGLVAIVPPHTAHSVRAVTDGKAIVTDSPVRSDLGEGRRGVIAVDFDLPVSLDEDSIGAQIPFTLRNWGKSRVIVRALSIEAKFSPELPAPTTTEMPGGELPTHCILEAGEQRAERIAISELTPRNLDELRSGVAILYVKGVVIYDDAFGSRQHRTFCSVYDRGAFGRKGGFVISARPGYNYGT
ncbi:MAG: cupin domain-containing protein [Candidatus Binataceae bacterium]